MKAYGLGIAREKNAAAKLTLRRLVNIVDMSRQT
jgi:hypothetical protein